MMTCAHHETITTGTELGEEFGTCQICGQVRRYYWQDGANYDLKRKCEITKEGVEPMNKERIINRYKNGDAIPSIIEEEGVTRKKLYEILHAHNIELRTPPENRRVPYKTERTSAIIWAAEPSPNHPAIEALLGFLPEPGTPINQDLKDSLESYFTSSIELMYPCIS